MHDWESIAWAAIQTFIADYMIGPAARDPLSKDSVQAPAEKGEKDLCGVQKMRKQGGFVYVFAIQTLPHQSINIFI